MSVCRVVRRKPGATSAHNSKFAQQRLRLANSLQRGQTSIFTPHLRDNSSTDAEQYSACALTATRIPALNAIASLQSNYGHCHIIRRDKQFEPDCVANNELRLHMCRRRQPQRHQRLPSYVGSAFTPLPSSACSDTATDFIARKTRCIQPYAPASSLGIAQTRHKQHPARGNWAFAALLCMPETHNM